MPTSDAQYKLFRMLNPVSAEVGEDMHPSDRAKLLVYLAKFLRKAGVNGSRGGGRRDEIADAASVLGVEPPEIPEDEEDDPEYSEILGKQPRPRPSRRRSELRKFDIQDRFRAMNAPDILRLFETEAIEASQKKSAQKPSVFGRRIAEISERFGFNSKEAQVLECAVLTNLYPLVREALQLRRQNYGSDFYPESIAHATGLTIQAVSQVTSRSALAECGMVTTASDGEIRISDQLMLAIRLGWRGKHGLANWFVGQPVKASLDWDCFEHISKERDHLIHLLEAALESHAAGVNILVYGPAGTGKTEFVRTLAARLKQPLFEPDQPGDFAVEGRRSAENSEERLRAARRASVLLSTVNRGLMVMDDAEDVLAGRGREMSFFGIQLSQTSNDGKLVLNRMLESTPRPVFWVVNSTSGIPDHVLRRFHYVMRLDVPSESVRAKVWQRLLRTAGVSRRSEDARLLARRYPVAPAVCASVVSAAKLAGGGMESVVQGVEAMTRAVLHRPPQQESIASEVPFLPTLIDSSPGIDEVEAAVEASGNLAFSFLLSGPAGTGKSAWVRELARRLKLEVMHVRASDLMGPYVGMTERLIANMFNTAASRGAFLILDEADSMLRSRSDARHQWEISMVNEMLTWMEGHPAPFACTTNLVSELDPATSRRFMFKVRLEFMSSEQIATAFNHFFGAPPPSKVLALRNLTPGDLANVYRSARLLGKIPRWCPPEGRVVPPEMLERIAGMVLDESELKQDQPTGSMGFSSHRRLG